MSGYLLSFTVYKIVGEKVSDIVYNKLLPIREGKNDKKFIVETNILYTYVVNNRLGIIMYGTLREDRGTQNYDLVNVIIDRGG